jgi:hypothetical protein
MVEFRNLFRHSSTPDRGANNRPDEVITTVRPGSSAAIESLQINRTGVSEVFSHDDPQVE